MKEEEGVLFTLRLANKQVYRIMSQNSSTCDVGSSTC